MTRPQPRPPRVRETGPSWLAAVPLLVATIPTGLAYAALLGLGVHRHAPPQALALAATVLLFAPAVMAGVGAAHRRFAVLGITQGVWAMALLAILPVYFPGERAEAVTTGLAMLGVGGENASMARSVASSLPAEPALGVPTIPEAAAVVEPVLPDPVPLAENQIALPYEGEGRRLSVPVAFGQGDAEAEISMMLDTGATYTTLPRGLLDDLGVPFRDGDPVVTLHTANGQRKARIVLIDRIWLGDLPLNNVAIAVCEECASTDNKGLLGLNVSGNFNLLIDADRREVVFTRRSGADRHLDVSPFLDTRASFSRFPGGRIEVQLELDNRAPHPVSKAVARVSCGEESWRIPVDGIGARKVVDKRTRLPLHEPCATYRIQLDQAWW